MKKTLFLTMLPSLSFAEGIDKKIDKAFAPISDFFSSVVFFTINDIPFVLMLLVFSALFFTIYFAFPNIRYFRVAVNTVRGKYDDLDNNKVEDTKKDDENSSNTEDDEFNVSLAKMEEEIKPKIIIKPTE